MSLCDIVHDCLEHSHRAEVSFTHHSIPSEAFANCTLKIRSLVFPRRSWMLESNLVLYHKHHCQR
jgi:hypothetical protein